MKVRDIVKRSGRSLRYAKVRTLLTAGAIAVGAFTLTLTLGASNGATSFTNKIVANNFDPAELIVTNDPTVLGQATSDKPQQYDPSFTTQANRAGIATKVKQLTMADITTIKAVPGVQSVRLGVSPTIQYVTRPASNGNTYKKYEATVDAFSPAQKPDLEAGTIPSNLDSQELLLPASYVSALGFSSPQAAIGKQVILAVQTSVNQAAVEQALTQGVTSLTSLQALAGGTTKTVAFTVVAVTKKPVVSQPGTDSLFYIGEDDASALNDDATIGTASYHEYSYIYARVQNGATNQVKLQDVESKLKSLGYQVESVKDTEAFLNQIISVLRGIVVAFGLIAIVASIFGVVNTMYISVLQRTREIGLMKALGMRRKDIGRLFRLEAALIGLIGGLLGSGVAIGLGVLLNPFITKKLDLGAGNYLLIFKPAQVIVLVVILVIVAIVAGLLPARKAAKLDPIEALRTE